MNKRMNKNLFQCGTSEARHRETWTALMHVNVFFKGRKGHQSCLHHVFWTQQLFTSQVKDSKSSHSPGSSQAMANTWSTVIFYNAPWLKTLFKASITQICWMDDRYGFSAARFLDDESGSRPLGTEHNWRMHHAKGVLLGTKLFVPRGVRNLALGVHVLSARYWPARQLSQDLNPKKLKKVLQRVAK